MEEELDDILIAEEYDRKYKNGEVELVDFDEFVKDRKEKYDLQFSSRKDDVLYGYHPFLLSIRFYKYFL